jgi:clan AA aspartic protease
MITGMVNPRRRAIVTLTIRGPLGQSLDVEAKLDTGFTESLSLPHRLVQALGLRLGNVDRVVLADGRIILVELYEATAVWSGQDRNVMVHCLEGTPLIGMFLIYHHLVTLEVRDHGPVTITPLP